ncbi:sulfurtransferase [Brucella anthropi]|uniref:chromate resistance protein ChrB domain-containing protein n=1 Tax=Brucella anthropi TaxID=529 RepID=UPI00124CE34C|nr:sulfurtransferase/chromate resistance protein [Brucella anthropi]KAB2793777.1 sulfurtransferase [Brucella anthropi]
MPSNTEITTSQLIRLIGMPDAPRIIDVRSADDLGRDPRVIPGAVNRDALAVETWADEFQGKQVIIYCQKGQKLSQGATAWLKHKAIEAETLEGGYEAWIASNASVVNLERLPNRDLQNRTVWVTRARPKIDRIACPWLIKRFIDPDAVFLFVGAQEVLEVADKFDATPFDIEGVFWSHRGDLCTFDVMIEEFGLKTPSLDRLATIVRGADTARLDLAPQCSGLLAASLGLSRMFKDDLEQLNAGLLLYDAFYRWARDAVDETHNWPSGKPGGQ